tara:strand:+ start:229 stop:1050 length:822 start_codon:yes stop_codon:yes gene_type:complete
MFTRLFKNYHEIPVIKLSGVIGGSGTLRSGLNLTNINKIIEKAFSNKKVPAVSLIINSPGGSPTQSSLIASKIRKMADKNKIKVYAFVEDIAASGGYWLACAADEIYIDKNSIVGSIGVISPGFGFVQMLKKIGIERRVYTSGKNKSFLDPFKSVKKEDIKRIKDLQDQIHQNFIDHVKKNRSKKIKSADKDIYNGNFWIGVKAVELGLADGIGHIEDILKNKFGEKTKIKIIEQKKSFLQRKLSSYSNRSLINTYEIIDAIEEKSYWTRFGL